MSAWTWTPEQNVPLSNIISMDGWEESAMKIWSEFLAGHYDGGNHHAAAWPKAVVLCQQSRLPQPLDGSGVIPSEGLAITVVTPAPGKTVKRWWGNGETKLNLNDETFTFIIRAQLKAGRTDGQNSESLCRTTADMLYRLCNTPEWRQPLTRAGVIKLYPSPHQVLDEAIFSTRRLSCRAVLSPPVKLASGTMPSLDGPSSNVVIEASDSPYSASKGRNLRIYGRTSTGLITVKLPANPLDGQIIVWKDVDSQAETYPPTIDGNGKLISMAGNGQATITWPINDGGLKLVYVGALGMWLPS